MNPKTWTDEQREEFDAICKEAEAEGGSTGERSRLFAELIGDAIQAQRLFARDVEREALSRGFLSIFKGWERTQVKPVLVSYKGEVLSKPRVIGTKRERDDGSIYDEQTLFDFMTWDELAAKRREYLTQLKSYRGNVATVDKLLALHELAPGATTPAEAAESIGTTVDAWLAEERAS